MPTRAVDLPSSPHLDAIRQALAPDASQSDPLCEAPCSVNGRLHLDGMDLQVTGRGATPAEMVAHFRGAVEALRAAYATPPTIATQIATLKACWVEKAVVLGDLGKAQRVLKAAEIILADGVRDACMVGMFRVRSQAGSVEYLVNPASGTCECEDHVRAVARSDAGQCKHLLAVEMFRRLA